MKRLRWWVARWLLRNEYELLWVEVPYRAALVVLPDDPKAWTSEQIDRLNASLEAEVGHPVAVVITDRRSTTLMVRIRERLP